MKKCCGRLNSCSGVRLKVSTPRYSLNRGQIAVSWQGRPRCRRQGRTQRAKQRHLTAGRSRCALPRGQILIRSQLPRTQSPEVRMTSRRRAPNACPCKIAPRSDPRRRLHAVERGCSTRRLLSGNMRNHGSAANESDAADVLVPFANPAISAGSCQMSSRPRMASRFSRCASASAWIAQRSPHPWRESPPPRRWVDPRCGGVGILKCSCDGPS